MDLLKLGTQSRKTGIKPRENLSKDKYDMEDIDEFFADEGEFQIENHENVYFYNFNKVISNNNVKSKEHVKQKGASNFSKSNYDHISRKINFAKPNSDFLRFSNVSPDNRQSNFNFFDSRLKSPLTEFINLQNGQKQVQSEHDSMLQQNLKTDFSFSSNRSNFDLSYDSLVSYSQNNKIKKDEKNNTFLTNSDDSKSFSESTKDSDNISDFQDDLSFQRSQNQIGSLSSINLNYLSPPLIDKVRKRIKKKKKKNLNDTSPYSSHSEGLRRSKRTKIPPLAYWRNERIIYVRANDTKYTYDNILFRDIKRIPLQKISEVVQVPETDNSNETVKKRVKSNTSNMKSKKINDNIYDDFDLDIPGSEWFNDKFLTVEIFEDGKKVEKCVAFAPDGGDFKNLINESNDNFEITTLFNYNKDFTACGLLNFPYEGFKSLKNSDNSIFNFHVTKGFLEVTISNNIFVVSKGCSFEVPNGNIYGLKNIGKYTARVFFVQIKIPINKSNQIQ